MFEEGLYIYISKAKIFMCMTVTTIIQKLSIRVQFLGKFRSFGTGQGQFNGQCKLFFWYKDVVLKKWNLLKEYGTFTCKRLNVPVHISFIDSMSDALK